MSLPDDPAQAMAAWRGAVNGAVTEWHRARGCDFPDLNDLDRRKVIDAIGFCFPHYFLLPQYSSASSYRIRPLGPEQTLFEVWSLTRYPNDVSPGKPTPPEPLAPDDPSWPMIPAQDFSNLPRQQKGLHAKGFEYMRLSNQIEGSDLQLRARHRRLPRRPAVRAAGARDSEAPTPPSTCPSPTSGCQRRFPHGELGRVRRPADRGQRRRGNGRRAGGRSIRESNPSSSRSRTSSEGRPGCPAAWSGCRTTR